jgi:hemerythrin-like domain-containing protein
MLIVYPLRRDAATHAVTVGRISHEMKEVAMSGHSPAGPLMREHRVIERMIAVLARQLDSIDTDGSVDPDTIDTVTDFIRWYADRCHHGKEEDILFQRLASKELDSALAGAMADLIEDHARGRALTRRLSEGNKRFAVGDTSALSEIGLAVQELVAFYPAHIEKEDHHFFKPCLEYFTDAEKTQMLKDFDDFDRALIHAKYLATVEVLERVAG